MFCASLHHRVSKMDDSSKMCDHMTKFICGCLETRGGSTSPLAQITPLSPSCETETSKLVCQHVTSCGKPTNGAMLL